MHVMLYNMTYESYKSLNGLLTFINKVIIYIPQKNVTKNCQMSKRLSCAGNVELFRLCDVKIITLFPIVNTYYVL